MLIRPAHSTEADSLTALMRRSKAHWGYTTEFLEAVVDQLTITEADIASRAVTVLETDGQAAGFYVLEPTDDPATLMLRDLFVDPCNIGAGYGKYLWDHAVAQARKQAISALIFDADPNALGFYQHMGAVQIGETASTVISGRVLPQMRYLIP